MSGLKAKFSKKLNGETEVAGFGNPLFAYHKIACEDYLPPECNGNSYNLQLKNIKKGDYTNFDNPIYTDGDSLDSPNYHSTANGNGSSESSISFGNKFSSDTKKKWLIIATIAAAVVLVVIVAVIIGTTVPKKKNTNYAVSSASKTKQPVKYQGSIKLIDKQYTSELEKPISPERTSLKAQFESDMNELMRKEGTGAPGYQSTQVTAFKSGSIIVEYDLLFTSGTDLTPTQVANAVIQGVTSNQNKLGDSKVDPDSIVVTKGDESSPTFKPEIPTTSQPPPSKSTETSVDSTVRPTQSTTPTPAKTTAQPAQPTVTPPEKIDYRCGNPIIPECAAVLPYASTKRTVDEQNRIKSAFLRLANHTSVCYEHSLFYMCSYIAPNCYTQNMNNGTVLELSTILPCQQTCHDIREQCKDVLEGVDTHNTIGDCTTKLPYTSSQTGQCVYPGSTPPIPMDESITTESPTNVTETGPMCFPIHHEYCSGVSWNRGYLPSYYGNISKISTAYSFLSYLQGIGDAGVRCHNQLHHLMCAIIVPECGPDENPIPPCRSFCNEVQRNCMLHLALMPHPIFLSCSQFTTNENCTKVGAALPNNACNGTTQYTCSDRQQCIALSNRCDGFPDCDDGSDEDGCVSTECGEDKFKCPRTGACISHSWKCDGFNDCGDGTDERDCVCGEDKYSCETSTGGTMCVNATYRCDGRTNCFNRSDERDCEGFQCRLDQFHCANGNCRPMSYKCDGDNDCGDNSDEVGCLADEVCPEDNFKCVNGSRNWGSRVTSCIPESWTCDRERDCKDGSDEKNCTSLCQPNPCRHDGTCDVDSTGQYCICPAGTTGTHCEIVMDLPVVNCHDDIVINGCKSVLAPHRNYTMANPRSQRFIAPYVEMGLERFDTCYEHSSVLLCQFLLPACGQAGFPILPCKSMCKQFKAQCAHHLNSTDLLGRLIDCDVLMDDEHFPEAACFKLNHTEPTVEPPPRVELGCQELKLNFCMDGTPNQMTYTPNYYNQTHQASAELILLQVDSIHSNYPLCSTELKKLMCTLFAPPCNAAQTAPIPPCQNLCVDVTSKCRYWLDHMNWNFPFDCHSFPDSSDPSICVQIPEPPAPIGCGSDQFTCSSGECISNVFKCDSFPDCDDASDEDTTLCESLSETTTTPAFIRGR